MKKLISVLTCLTLILAMIPVNAFAVPNNLSDGYYPVLSNTAGLDSSNSNGMQGLEFAIDVSEGMNISKYAYVVHIESNKVTGIKKYTGDISVRYKVGGSNSGPVFSEDLSKDLVFTKIADKDNPTTEDLTASNKYRISYSIQDNSEETAAGFEYDVRFTAVPESYNLGVNLAQNGSGGGENQQNAGYRTVFSYMPDLSGMVFGGTGFDEAANSLFSSINVIEGDDNPVEVYLYIAEYNERGQVVKILEPSGSIRPGYMATDGEQSQFEYSEELTFKSVDNQPSNRFRLSYVDSDKSESIRYTVRIENNTSEGVPSIVEGAYVNIQAAVDATAFYELRCEMLDDPAAYNGTLPTDRMRIIGQGTALQFTSELNEWESCFYVRNNNTGYDARWKENDFEQEQRTYLGYGADSFGIMARKIGTGTWMTLNESGAPAVFSLEYEGDRLDHYNVYKIVYTPGSEKTSTDIYEYCLMYKEKDPYLDSSDSNRKYVFLERVDDNQAGWSFDCIEPADNNNIGNVLHFSRAGATHDVRFVLRPSVLKSVIDKKIYTEKDYIDLSGEDLSAIKVYRKSDTGYVEADKSPFDIITKDENSDLVEVQYSDPDKDKYGPEYMLKLTKLPSNAEGSDNISDMISLWTPKVTCHVSAGDVTGGKIDATTDDIVNATEVIIDKGAAGGDVAVSTNQGTVELDSTVTASMDSQNTSLEIRDATEDSYGLSQEQVNALSDASAAVDLTLENDETGEKVDFNSGTATVTIDCNDADAGVVYIDEEGNETPVASTVDGNGKITFTTNHFSLYAVKKGVKYVPPVTGGGSSAGSGETIVTSDGKVTVDGTDGVLSDKTAERIAAVADSSSVNEVVIKGDKLTVSAESLKIITDNAVITLAASEGSITIGSDAAKEIGTSGSAVIDLVKADTDNGPEYKAVVTVDGTQVRVPVKVTAKIPDELKGREICAVTPVQGSDIYGKGLAVTEGTAGDGTFTVSADEFILMEKTAAEALVKSNNEVVAKNVTKSMKPVVSAKIVGTKKIKITAAVSASKISKFKSLGYTVKYKFYRSTKKTSGYILRATRKGNTYTNISGKKGTKYYYKVKVYVYDKNGKVVTSSSLSSSGIGSRIFS